MGIQNIDNPQSIAHIWSILINLPLFCFYLKLFFSYI